MYYVAYQNIYAKEGNMTKGTDGRTIDGMSISRVEQLIIAIRNESYQPAPSRRTYIPKKNGKKRPLGISSFDDKLVQEVIRMILQAIYEGHFENSSHGFRPKRSCHTALTSLQKTFTGTKWFVEGDIKGFFDNIDHDVLIGILAERVADNRFLRLVRKFLNAGYLEDWVFNSTYSGTPQGGIVSPILANIYLDKLDKYMADYILKFDAGKKRAMHPVAARYHLRRVRAVRKLKTETGETLREQLIRKIKDIEKQRILYPASQSMDGSYKRLKYVRYADDFLISVIGSKADAQMVKEDITKYLADALKLELSAEKTLITNAKDTVHFLGYEIYVRRSDATKRNIKGAVVRSFSSRVVLNVSNATMKKKLLEYDAMTIKVINGKEVWRHRARPCMKNNDDLEILSQYNSEIRGFYNYYSIANNSYTIDSFYNIMEYSMYKTYACKYRSSTRKMIRKFNKDGAFAVAYTNKKGQTRYRMFYDKGFKRKSIKEADWTDTFPSFMVYTTRTSLMDRIKANQCEFCNNMENDLQMHHVRKLKDLKGKQDWEKHMIARRRKTLAVCKKCHRKIHNGKMD
ncbi:reverse transcriptase domain-containing protein [Mucilaginibacter pineti]|nr:reverse transcriptase domain-containing protein [Mucilaginibacter pineti]